MYSDNKEVNSFSTPKDLSSPSHVASINPTMSTATVSTLSSGSKYYDSVHKKRRFQQLCREQDAIMNSIIGEQEE